jgi:hypothetical protein
MDVTGYPPVSILENPVRDRTLGPGTMDWSREVKEIYELFPSLKLIVSGSSLLQLREGDADLSRRAIKYIMPQGNSFGCAAISGKIYISKLKKYCFFSGMSITL